MSPLLNPPVLASASVRLRPWEHKDTERLPPAAADPDVAQHAGLDPHDPDSSRHYIARQQLRLERGLGYSFAITSAETDDCLGQIGAWLRDPAPDGATGYIEEPHGRAALAYWVLPDARGHGLAAAALDVLAEWLLEQAAVQRLELFIEPENIASTRSAERAGFIREGLLRSWQQIAGRRRDVYIYSRISTDGTSRARCARRRLSGLPLRRQVRCSGVSLQHCPHGH